MGAPLSGPETPASADLGYAESLVPARCRPCRPPSCWGESLQDLERLGEGVRSGVPGRAQLSLTGRGDVGGLLRDVGDVADARVVPARSWPGVGWGGGRLCCSQAWRSSHCAGGLAVSGSLCISGLVVRHRAFISPSASTVHPLSVHCSVVGSSPTPVSPDKVRF